MATFYVSAQTGNENNDGRSIDKPFKSLSAAFIAFQAFPIEFFYNSIVIIDNATYFIGVENYNYEIGQLFIVSDKNPTLTPNSINSRITINSISPTFGLSVEGITISRFNSGETQLFNIMIQNPIRYDKKCVLIQPIENGTMNVSNTAISDSTIRVEIRDPISNNLIIARNSGINSTQIRNSKVNITNFTNTNTPLNFNIFNGNPFVSDVNVNIIYTIPNQDPDPSSYALFGQNDNEPSPGQFAELSNIVIDNTGRQATLYLCDSNTDKVTLSNIQWKTLSEAPKCRSEVGTLATLQQSLSLEPSVPFTSMVNTCTLAWNGGISVSNTLIPKFDARVTNKRKSINQTEYTVNYNDTILTVDASFNNIKIVIPDFDGSVAGKLLFFRRIDGSNNKVKILAVNQRIDDKLEVSLRSNRYINIYHNKNTPNWYCIGQGKGIL